MEVSQVGLAAASVLCWFILESPAAAAPFPDSLYAWYRGDAGLQATPGGQVTTWQNQATTGVPATRDLDRISGTPQSVRMRASGGDWNVVRCDGADGVWGTATDFGTLTGSRSIAAYCRLTAAGDGFLFDSSTNVSGLTRAQVRGGSWQVGLQPGRGRGERRHQYLTCGGGRLAGACLHL